jgi:asparagine synthase (glutamine-hydrolysing)
VNARELLEAGSAGTTAHFAAHTNLNERLASDVLQYSTPDLLRYEDKNSMAFSIEARVPFLDHELVEFIFSLPIDQKIKGGWNRAVYRNAMKGRMPEKNRLRRSKIGFTNPDITWMKGKASEIRAIFSSSELASRDLYNPAQLVTAWDEYLAGRPGDGLIFWRVLVTELWMRRYMDQAVAV